ncbi:hypothetical protein [Paractinoplanes atraurantiacus]|uniref:CGA synthase-related protein n=1 Tax=Paractinoplanes atraurantiacus TaxID=1036182 RepID=A0A285J026_9ACTN|nr:hypothetical protein [Actinoplanes atraurantiacus]SNY53582.1 CGA synthase-related protein [Actinoplanes atraurantiacus]
MTTTTRWGVLLVPGDDLDSRTAVHRVSAHLSEMDVVLAPGADPDQAVTLARSHSVRAALVAGAADATAALQAAGYAVLHLHAGAAEPAGPPPAAALVLAHRPRWSDRDEPLPRGVQRVLSFTPVRRGWNGRGSYRLMALAVGAATPEAVETYTREVLLPLVEGSHEPVRILTDGPPAAVLAGLRGVPADVLTTSEAALDDLHAGCVEFAATPSLAALTLARARGKAPMALLPPLDAAQERLRQQVTKTVRIADAADAGRDPVDWSVLDAFDDDLSGAQRVARKLRQLAIAPWA